MQGFTFSVHPEALENAVLCVSVLSDSATQVCFTPRPFHELSTKKERFLKIVLAAAGFIPGPGILGLHRPPCISPSCSLPSRLRFLSVQCKAQRDLSVKHLLRNGSKLERVLFGAVQYSTKAIPSVKFCVQIVDTEYYWGSSQCASPRALTPSSFSLYSSENSSTAGAADRGESVAFRHGSMVV